MATFNSTEFGNTVANPIVPNLPNVDEARMRWKFATLAAGHGNTLAQNDLVNLFTLPDGAKPVLMTRANGAFGSGVTLDVGFSGDENAFESAVSVSVATATSPVLTAVDDPTPLVGAKVIQAKFEGGNPADNVQLTIGIGYLTA